MNIENVIALTVLPLDKLQEVEASPEDYAAALELIEAEERVMRERQVAVEGRMREIEAEQGWGPEGPPDP